MRGVKPRPGGKVSPNSPDVVRVFKAQSGVLGDEAVSNTANPNDNQQQLLFSDEVAGEVYDTLHYVDPTRHLQDNHNVHLGDFFSRPIRIQEYEWGTGLSLYQSFKPWENFFTNKRVINRLANFKLLRCKLHLKILINGNGFLYGRALASYLPLEGYDFLSVNRSLISQDLIAASQRPRIFLNPTNSEGGDIILPFFWHKNYLSITNEEWADMGEVVIRSINDLLHANGASDQCTISVFAWAEDVEVAVPTSNTPTMTPQMGTLENDQANRNGVVSKPATTIARIANTLRTIPSIAPFAMATEIGANAVAGIASAFGYSSPVVTKAPDPMVPHLVGDMATANTPDTCFKLTYDDAQELTIDPRISGLDSEGDVLAIKSIAARESYLTKFAWTVGTAPDAMLWNVRVQPTMWDEVANEFHLTPLAVVSHPFKYWTGSLRFRFQVVSSNFHRGRLRIVYDPDYNTVTDEFNINYMQIIDVAEHKDFTVTIGNGQEISYLEHLRPGYDLVSECFSTTAYTTKGVGNGVLGIYVVNELTVPNSTAVNDIEINVFVSAAEDFEVAVPTSDFQTMVFREQMGVVENNETTDKLVSVNDVVMGPQLTISTDLNKVFIGETLSSLRTWLKRYSHSIRLQLEETANTTLQYSIPAQPMYRGNVPGAIHSTATLAPYTYSNTTPFHWVVSCFNGYRGAHRWKFTPANKFYDYDLALLTVERYTDEATYQSNSTNTLAAATSTHAGAESAVFERLAAFSSYTAGRPSTGIGGKAITSGSFRECLEVEVPFYSNHRFKPGKTADLTSFIDYGGMNILCERYGSSTGMIDCYHSVGEDFQVYAWTGMPPLFFEASPPAPQ